MILAAAAMLPGAALAQDVMATTDLNLRDGPGPNAAILDVIPADGMVMLEGCVSGTRWCQVDYDGTVGFAYADYLVNAGATDPIITADVQTVEVDTGFVAGATAGALIGGPIGAAVGGVAGAIAGDAAVDRNGAQGAAEAYAASDPDADPIYLDGEVVVGAGIPEGVDILAIPDNDLGYMNLNGMQVIVNPADRRIVSVLR